MTTLRDHLKTVVGDQQNDAYSDAEYDRFIKRRMRSHVESEADANLIENSSPSEWIIGRSLTPVFQLEVKDDQGNSYTTDAYSGFVTLDSGSDSRDPLRVTYHRVDWEHILADIYEALASDEAKVAILQESGGFDMDLRELSNHLWKTAERWRARARHYEKGGLRT